MAYLNRFRSGLATLFDIYGEATGRRLSNISFMVANDPKFGASFRDRDMRVGTYDLVTARFSAIWPPDLPWPEGIERPAPAELPEDVQRLLERRARVPDSEHVWPADKPWPADIPRPDASPKQPISGQGA